LPGALIGAIGAILFGVGAAMDTGRLDTAGAVILAVGLVASRVLNHVTVEYGRLESLEKKKRRRRLDSFRESQRTTLSIDIAGWLNDVVGPRTMRVK
jgi:hypothetical protein